MKRQGMVKAILFDFWGTLVEQGVRSPLKQVQTMLNIQLPFGEYVVRMERALMTKEFAGLHEAFAAVCQEFGLGCEERKIEQLVGLWNKSWMLAHLYDDVEEVLGQLQQNYQLILVSNTDCISVSRVLEKIPLHKYFQRMYFSCLQGCLKTDPQFLAHILKEISLTPGECVYVGDSLQSDLAPAERAGIKAILIDRQDRRDFFPKICSLRELERHL